MGLFLAYEQIKKNEGKDNAGKSGAAPTRQGPTVKYNHPNGKRVDVQRKDFADGKSQLEIRRFPSDKAAAAEANKLDHRLTNQGFVRSVGGDATGDPRPGGHLRKPSSKEGK